MSLSFQKQARKFFSNEWNQVLLHSQPQLKSATSVYAWFTGTSPISFYYELPSPNLWLQLDPYHASVTFHEKESHLICSYLQCKSNDWFLKEIIIALLWNAKLEWNGLKYRPPCPRTLVHGNWLLNKCRYERLKQGLKEPVKLFLVENDHSSVRNSLRCEIVYIYIYPSRYLPAQS